MPKELHDYNFNSIRVVQLPRDASAADASGMSGTKMREYVQNNDIEGFKTGVTQSAQPYAKEMFKKLQGIMGVDPVEEGIFDLISFSGDEMEEKYIPFVIKNIRRYGDKRTKALLMKKFPDIKPVDANRAVKQALDIIAKRG